MLMNKPLRRKRIICKCNMCNRLWETGKEYDKYICMDCAEKYENGGFSKQNRMLIKAWGKKGLVYM